MVQPASVAFSALSSSAAGTDRVPVGQEGFSLAIRRFPSPRALQGHPALVYAHGFGQTRGAWNRTGLAMAAHGYAGLAYDARGHGESDRNAAGLPYTGDQFADDLIVMAGEQPEPPVLVGASMGGLFGLIAESRWPGLFRAMVLVDITPRWEHAGLQRILAFMTAFPDGFDSLEHAADAIAAYQPQRRTRKSADDLRELLREGGDGRWRWHWDPELFNSDNGLHAAQEPGRFVAAAAQLTLPTLLVRGKLSDLVSEETAQEFLELVPHAQFVDVSGAGHMVAGDRNDRFCDAVVEFLEALPTT